MKKHLFLRSLFFCFPLCSFGQYFQSVHFTIQKCADGVYAVIAKNGQHAYSNAGIVDLGDATLVFDTFMSPDAASDLEKAAVQLTGHKVTYVVNSHFHVDHIAGNQLFDKALIISTEGTRNLILKYQLKEITDNGKAALLQLDTFNRKNTSTMSPVELGEHLFWKAYWDVIAKYHDSLRTVLPNLTFDNKLILHGTKRTVELLTYGKGHTESDLFLYLPMDQIAFVGDLLFIQFQPWTGDGDPEMWATYLDSIARLNVKILVPGHGPVGTVASIDSTKLFFKMLKETAMDYHKSGTLPENDLNLKTPAPFDKWFLSSMYRDNLIAEYNRLYRK